MTPLVPLSERNVGWLRYLHRKATTPDSWERQGHPHDHWDNLSDPPMLCYHRFDLIDSTYAVALMADRTPAWREVYEQILDELIFRHTGWWAAEDWLTQIGDDPDRGNYPDAYRMLIPAAHWGNYNVPGWTANGVEPWGLQWDPIGADGNLFFKGFFLVMLGLHRRVTGNARWDTPFDIVRDGEHTYTWWHTKIAEHLAGQWRAHPEGCHCENTKIWPYCLAGAGFGLQLADQAFGTNHHEVFDVWWEIARRDYLHLDSVEPPTAVTFYYDPIIDEHLELPAAAASIPGIYLAPQVPDEARRLWDTARAQMGLLDVTGPVPVIGPRFTAMALLLARNWAVTDLADALQAACDENYPPTWDRERCEVTWDFDLSEDYPRGQYNAMMAAAEVMTEGAWWRLSNIPSSDRFDEPTVCDVDFPTVSLTRAEWDGRAQELHLAMHAINGSMHGRPTTMRVTGLGDPSRWTARTSDGPQVEVTTKGSDLLLHTSVGQHSVVVEQS
jgi:Linalool dehydratase/isomerase